MKWKRNDEVIKIPIVEYLEQLFEKEMEKGMMLKVSIGTDSQKASRGSYKFATVILIRTIENLGGGVTVGRGGMIISSTYYNEFKAKNKELVNERMVFEVSKSVEVAYEIAPLLDLYEVPLEIHADINPDPIHESNKALQQAIGYILGMGYSFKVKPDAYAASNAADKKC
ncbi:MAG: ribonuclease H-like YkuK family protein [Bacteroidota bacterium]